MSSLMKRIALEHGSGGKPAPYKVLSRALEVSDATLTRLFNDAPGASADLLRKVADRAGYPRHRFLIPAGYIPAETDWEHDATHYGTAADPRERAMIAFAALGEVLDDPSLFFGEAPGGPPERREALTEAPTTASTLGYDYAVRVKGDSMAPFLNDGDVAYIRVTERPDFGSVVIAVVEGDVVCKRLAGYHENEAGEWVYTLKPDNGKHREVRSADIRFQGVVVGRFAPLNG